MFLIEAIGWVGTALVLYGYALVTREGVSPFYHAVNAVGAACLLTNTAYHHSLPAVALNLAWLTIAAYGMKESNGRSS